MGWDIYTKLLFASVAYGPSELVDVHGGTVLAKPDIHVISGASGRENGPPNVQIGIEHIARGIRNNRFPDLSVLRHPL